MTQQIMSKEVQPTEAKDEWVHELFETEKSKMKAWEGSPSALRGEVAGAETIDEISAIVNKNKQFYPLSYRNVDEQIEQFMQKQKLQ